MIQYYFFGKRLYLQSLIFDYNIIEQTKDEQINEKPINKNNNKNNNKKGKKERK